MSQVLPNALTITSLPHTFVLAGTYMCTEPEGVRIQLDGVGGSITVRPRQPMVPLQPMQRVRIQYTTSYREKSRAFGGNGFNEAGIRTTADSIIPEPESKAPLFEGKNKPA